MLEGITPESQFEYIQHNLAYARLEESESGHWSNRSESSLCPHCRHCHVFLLIFPDQKTRMSAYEPVLTNAAVYTKVCFED